MKQLSLAVLMAIIATSLLAQPAAEEALLQHETTERDRIRQDRAREQALFAAQDIACYQRFAVNGCLAEVRDRRRAVLGDLRRQEILLNDTQRKRRAAEQVLRADERAPSAP